jgi:transcriptional regulator with PAS, ATPase and Fis domain
MANKYNTENPQLCALRVADPGRFVHEVSRMIAKHKGNITNAAEALRVDRRTLNNWVGAHVELKKAVREARAT